MVKKTKASACAANPYNRYTLTNPVLLERFAAL